MFISVGPSVVFGDKMVSSVCVCVCVCVLHGWAVGVTVQFSKSPTGARKNKEGEIENKVETGNAVLAFFCCCDLHFLPKQKGRGCQQH